MAQHPLPRAERHERSPLRRSGPILSLLLGAGLLTLLLLNVSLREVWATLRGASPPYLIVTVLASLTASGLRSLRFAVLFPPGRRRAELYGVFACGRLVKYAMPFHAGELALIGLLHRYRLAPTPAETAPGWVLLRLGDLAAVSLLLVVMGGAAVPLGLSGSWWIPAVGAVAGGVLVVLVLPRLVRLAADHTSEGGWIGRRAAELARGIPVGLRPGSWARLLALSVLLWVAMVGTATLAQLAVATPLTPMAGAGAALADQAVSLLPVHPPLGIGTDDAAWAAIMVALGVPAHRAMPLALAIRAVLVASLVADALVGGSVLLVTRWRRQPR